MEKKKGIKKSEKGNSEKEKVCEIFEVKKNGEEKTIETCGTEEEKKPSNEQLKKENKIFRNVIIVMVCFFLLFLVVYLIINSTKHFTVNGVNFEIDQKTMAGKTIYRTSLPVFYNGTKADYNFYFRNDPRKLIEIPFDGGILIKKDMVINMTGNFNCGGEGVIGIANLQNLYQILGTNVIKDENASCDSFFGRYAFLKFREGNETDIEEYGLKGSCYNLYVNNCEILQSTERFMLETLIEVHKELSQKA